MLKNQTIDIFENELEGRELFIFGASYAGKKTIDFCNEKGYLIKGILDNSKAKEGSKFEGYIVFAPDYLLTLDKENVIVLIASVYLLEIDKQLCEMGMKHVFSAHLCKMIGQRDFPPVEEKDMDKIEILKSIVKDQKSIDTIERIVKLRNEDQNLLHEVFSGRQYFQKDIFEFNDEVFLDCGCYIGEEIDYLENMNCGIHKIYAFEPDDKNFEILKEKYSNKQNVELINKGVWSEKTELHFCSLGTDASTISEEGTEVVEVTSIDEEDYKDVTFIKMDIEGSEIQAINGARKTIQKYFPKLAICVYHKPKDLWEIPMLIKEISPQYDIYIRQHSLGLYDTVMYAIYNRDK